MILQKDYFNFCFKIISLVRKIRYWLTDVIRCHSILHWVVRFFFFFFHDSYQMLSDKKWSIFQPRCFKRLSPPLLSNFFFSSSTCIDSYQPQFKMVCQNAGSFVRASTISWGWKHGQQFPFLLYLKKKKLNSLR